MRVYLAGPMSGRPNYNYDTFRTIAKKWRTAGHDVLDPSSNFDGDQSLPYEVYMRQALVNVMSAQAVAVLPEWETSKGASMEVAVALQLGLPLYDAWTMQPLRLRFDGIRTTPLPLDAPVIAITGKLKSGKTTLADLVTAEFGIPRASFAAALKEGALRMGLVVDGPHKDRECLQQIGTDVVRRYKGADHWVNVFADRYADALATGLVCDDCRFENELDFFQRRDGAITVRIRVSPETQVARGADPSTFDHPSETALDAVPDAAFDIVFEEGIAPERELHTLRQYVRQRRVDWEFAHYADHHCLYVTPTGTRWLERPRDGGTARLLEGCGAAA